MNAGTEFEELQAEALFLRGAVNRLLNMMCVVAVSTHMSDKASTDFGRMELELGRELAGWDEQRTMRQVMQGVPPAPKAAAS